MSPFHRLPTSIARHMQQAIAGAVACGLYCGPTVTLPVCARPPLAGPRQGPAADGKPPGLVLGGTFSAAPPSEVPSPWPASHSADSHRDSTASAEGLDRTGDLDTRGHPCISWADTSPPLVCRMSAIKKRQMQLGVLGLLLWQLSWFLLGLLVIISKVHMHRVFRMKSRT